MSKPASNKEKIGYISSMLFYAVTIIILGFFLTFSAGLSYESAEFKLVLMFLIPTITATIVVFLGIITVKKLTTKQPTNNKKNKKPIKKALVASIIFGITVIIVFALIWSNLLASSYRPPREYPQIYIKQDGTIQPPSTQIKQEGTLYTLQADITLNRFYIEKNDITLDGNGYKINIVGPSIGRSRFTQGYIELSQVNNVTLKNLLTQMNTKLITQNSGHCTIQECTFLSFEIINSHHITITNNTKPSDYSRSTGSLLYQSTNCTIQKTQLSELKLVRANQNKILQNQIAPISDDVLLWFEDSNCNLFFNNYINCDVSKLFSMTGQTSNNLIVANNFTDYAYYEPTFSHNGTNTFYHNNFFNANWLQSDQNFTQSKWDNGQTGNYWSNYQGLDQNNDRVGDTTHIIDQNNQDPYPLTNPINVNQEIQPQQLPCTQILNPYTEPLQEEFPQTTLVTILVIATITIIGLILKRKQIRKIKILKPKKDE